MKLRTKSSLENWLNSIKQYPSSANDLDDLGGKTFLISAIMSNRIQYIREYLNINGVDVEKTYEDKTALQWAIDRKLHHFVPIFQAYYLGEKLKKEPDLIKSKLKEIRENTKQMNNELVEECILALLKCLILNPNDSNLTDIFDFIHQNSNQIIMSNVNLLIKNYLGEKDEKVGEKTVIQLAKYLLEKDLFLSTQNWLKLAEKFPDVFVNAVNAKGETLLINASCDNKIDIATQTLNIEGVDLDFKSQGKDALDWAISRGANDIEVMIFKKKLSNQWGIIKALEYVCLDIQEGCSPLVVKSLVKALIQYVVKNNQTAKLNDVFQYLDKSCIDTASANALIQDYFSNNKDKINDQTIKQLAKHLLKKGLSLSSENWLMLAEKFPDEFVNAVNANGDTLLIHAAFNNEIDIAEQVLNIDGVDLDFESHEKSALGWANYYNNRKISNLIVRKMINRDKYNINNKILPRMAEAVCILKNNHLLDDKTEKMLTKNADSSINFSKVIITLNNKKILSMLNKNSIAKLRTKSGNNCEIISKLNFSDKFLKLYLYTLNGTFENHISNLDLKNRYDLFMELKSELIKNYYSLYSTKMTEPMKEIYDSLKLSAFKYQYKKKCGFKVGYFWLFGKRGSTMRYQVFNNDPNLTLNVIEKYAMQKNEKKGKKTVTIHHNRPLRVQSW